MRGWGRLRAWVSALAVPVALGVAWEVAVRMCGRPVGFKGELCRKTGGGYECDHVSGLAVRYR